MTQTARVLAALRSRGAHGITAADFAAGRVIDGQKPIMRVAARILELRQAGHRIEVIGERDGGCYVYRLVHDTQDNPPPRPTPHEPGGSLFTGHQPRLAIFDDNDCEAA
jgi:hypothetical protein